MISFVEIESQEDVGAIRAAGLQLWRIVRMPIFFKLRKGFQPTSGRKQLLRTINHFFFGLPKFFNLFVKCDVLYASDSSELKKMAGVFFNCMFFYFYEELS